MKMKISDFAQRHFNPKSSDTKIMKKAKPNMILCKKTFYSYVSDDNLADNGIDPNTPFKDDDECYPLFIEGQEYRLIGPMNTIAGIRVSYVESDLILKYNRKKLSEKFYFDEFCEKKVKRFNDKKSEMLEKYKEDTEMINDVMKNPPRMEPFISDYFEIKE